MKSCIVYFFTILVCYACHDSSTVQPDPNGITDPHDSLGTLDTLDPVVPPLDTFLIQQKLKWEGEYIGERIHRYYKQGSPEIWDTIHNMNFRVFGIQQDSIHPHAFFITFQISDFPELSFNRHKSLLLDEDAIFTYILGPWYFQYILHSLDTTVSTYHSTDNTFWGGDSNTSWGYFKKQ